MPHSRMKRCVLIGYGLGCSALAATAVTAVLGVAASQPPTVSQTSPADPSDHAFDAARVLGAKACIRCHRSEYVAWMKTKHFHSDRRLKSDTNVLKYAQAMGIADGKDKLQDAIPKVLKGSMCVSCHATPAKPEGGTVAAHGGVSCESCHGPSGGDPGWLNRHAVYGYEGTRREQETAAHRAARLAFCRKHGKIGPDDLYATARKCLQCHFVGNEKLLQANHPFTNTAYELASWATGEVRHNFHLDQSRNALASTLWMNPVGTKRRHAQTRVRQMYIVGTLAETELLLRYRAGFKDAGVIGQHLAARMGLLSDRLAALHGLTGAAEVKSVADIATEALGKLAVVEAGDAKYYNAQADKVATAARTFLAKRDLSQLDAVKLKSLDAKINEQKPHYSSAAGKK